MGASDQGVIGASVRRKEDYRFLTGAGQYTDDINPPHHVHAYFLRSPHAHAKIRKIDAAKAKAAPGVVAIFTGADLTGVNGLPCGWLITGTDGKPMNEPPHPVLAQGKVRYVGDAVVLVIAETPNQAKDAAELVVVDYDVLPSVVNCVDALKPGAPQIHDAAPGNKCYTWALGDKAAVDAAFAKAAHVTKLDIVNNRLIPNAIEPRAAVASYSRADDSYTLYVSNQNPHVERLLMTAFVLGLPEHKVRVIAPDVGGGFGSKIYLYAEETAMVWASKRVNRPIKWAAERSESFLSDAHGRDHVTHAELALDKDGKFLAMRVHTTAAMGAYLSTFSTCIPTILYATLLAGQYTTPVIYAEVTASFTNTAPVDAYRGAGRPEATYVVERLVHQAAVDLGLPQDDIRRRNFHPHVSLPDAGRARHDTGNYDATLDEAKKIATSPGSPRARQIGEARQAARNRLCVLHRSLRSRAIERRRCAARARAVEVAAEVRVHPTGSVTVFTGSHSHGQGHETTFAAVVAARLGMSVDNVDIVHGDTGRVPFGMGTYGSRSLSVGGTAIVKAFDKIVDKGKKIAAHLLEAAEADIEFKDGVSPLPAPIAARRSARWRSRRTCRQLPARQAGLKCKMAFYDPTNFTYPAGTHICEVEIDPAKGSSKWWRVRRFRQHHQPDDRRGSGAWRSDLEGIGQALLEACVYDSESGQLLTGSYTDYAMPRADDVPSFKVGTKVTPCTHNPLGVRRGGRDRRAGRDDERGARRTAGAGVSISTCRRRRTAIQSARKI